jgi:hypothetical protein
MSGAAPASTVTVSLNKGLAAMPVKGSKEAPKTFTGDPDELEDFLERFDVLAAGAQLTDPDKIKALRQYLDIKQRLLFETLDGWVTQNWNDLTDSLKAIFLTSSHSQRFTLTTLASTVKKWSQTPLRSEQEILTYYRNFIMVSKWLKAQNKLTDDEENRYFWFGFNPQTRRELENQLRIMMPLHDRSNPYPMNRVLEAAKYIFYDLRFDQTAPSGLMDFSGPITELDEVPDYQEEFLPIPRVKRTVPAAEIESYSRRAPDGERQEVITRRVHFPQVQQTPSPEPHETAEQAKQREIEDLVGKLMTLGINEREYGVAYVKLLMIAPHTIGEFAKPIQAGVQAIQGQRPSFARNLTAETLNSSLTPLTSLPRPRFVCYFCGKSSPECYGTKNCLTARQYINDKKIIQKDGYLTFPDGSQIPQHEKGMKFVMDEFQKSTATTMFFAAVPHTTASPSNYGSFLTEIEEDVLIPGEDLQVPKEDPYAGKHFTILPRNEASPSLAFTRASARKANAPLAVPSQSKAEVPKPSATPPNPSQTSRPHSAPAPPSVPQFRFSSKAEEERLIDSAMAKILENPVRLEGREVFAIAPEIRRRMVDLLKTNKVPTPAPVVTQTSVQTNLAEAQVLLNANEPQYSTQFREIDLMLPNGVQARGVFDTGSEIVAICEDILIQTMHPVNPNLRTRMTTANSSESNLVGCAEQLPIIIGPITSFVQAHVV